MDSNDTTDTVINNYLEETQERLDRIAADLLEIEAGVMIDQVGLKRELHTLKGLSGMVGFHDVEHLCHLMESFMESRSDSEVSGDVQALFDGCDFISVHVDAVIAGEAPPVPPKSILERLQKNTIHTPSATKEKVADLLLQEADQRSEAVLENTAEDLVDPPAKRMRYLIVDDNEMNRELLLDILYEHGDCDLAEGGRQAIDTFESALKCGNPYDAIFLDIMMPDIDGHVTLETVRCIEHQHALYGSEGVKIIMVTAADSEQHTARAFRTGCQSYVAKPIDESCLFAAMRRLRVLETAPEKSVLRYLDDVTNVTIKTESGSTLLADVVNESRVDINILLYDVSCLRPTQEIEVLYKGVPMTAVIETIDPQDQNVNYPVRLVWK